MVTNYSKEASDIFSEGVIAEELSLRPVVLEIVGNVSDKRVFDIGCGDGRYSKIFAEQGAEVIGIDASPHQIDIAKEKNNHEKIKYLVGDASNTSEISDNSMDLVFSNLVVCDMDKKIIERFFKKIYSVLKKDGRLVFSMIHPLYICKDQDDFDKPLEFKKRDYFQEGMQYAAEGITKKGNKMKFKETHFTITFISQILEKTGFLIKRIVESKQVPEKGMFLPKYLVLECVKK